MSEHEPTHLTVGPPPSAEQEAPRDRFSELLQNRMRGVVTGQFESTLPNIEFLSLTRPEKAESEQLHVTIFRKGEDGKQRHVTLTLNNEGILFGKLPRDFQDLSKDQIKEEVCDIVERVDLSFWYQTDEAILPPGERIDASPVDTTERKRSKEVRVDPRRIEFMESQSDVLFGFVGEGDGFRKYYGFVFTWGIVLENPEARNAAFFVRFDTPITISEERMALPAAQRIPQSERQAILDRYWGPLRTRTKAEVVDLGLAERVRHKPVDSWIDQMTKELDRRRPQQEEDVPSGRQETTEMA